MKARTSRASPGFIRLAPFSTGSTSTVIRTAAAIRRTHHRLDAWVGAVGSIALLRSSLCQWRHGSRKSLYGGCLDCAHAWGRPFLLPAFAKGLILKCAPYLAVPTC